MKVGSSLFTRLLLWFFTTLVAIGLVLFALFSLQFSLPDSSPFRLDAGPKLISVARLIAQDLVSNPSTHWDLVIAEYTEAYGVDFILYTNTGRRLAGGIIPVPAEVEGRITRETGRPPGHGLHATSLPVPPPSPQPAPHSTGAAARLPDATVFSVHTSEPSLYWAGIRIPIYRGNNRPSVPGTLLAVSDSITGHGLFFNVMPWVLVILVVIVLATFFWLPLARTITRPISRMTRAAERIASGHFDTRLETKRRDEIGRLGSAINDMSSRLEDHVKGQKRFLGDVAHELASPVARIRLGLGILEDQLDGKSRERVLDVQEEVQQMSDLVDELLSFSRADAGRRQATIQTVDLEPLIRKVVDREEKESMDIRISVEDGLRPFANPELLARALSNLLRNSIRYAGDAGPIRVEARRDGSRVSIAVLDAGPGVPDGVLHRLFEPFYRAEASRSRDTGGVGLGLAIVSTCVEACRGTVSARNREGGGFAVTIGLDGPPAPTIS